MAAISIKQFLVIITLSLTSGCKLSIMQWINRQTPDKSHT